MFDLVLVSDLIASCRIASKLSNDSWCIIFTKYGTIPSLPWSQLGHMTIWGPLFGSIFQRARAFVTKGSWRPYLLSVLSPLPRFCHFGLLEGERNSARSTSFDLGEWTVIMTFWRRHTIRWGNTLEDKLFFYPKVRLFLPENSTFLCPLPLSIHRPQRDDAQSMSEVRDMNRGREIVLI